MELFATLAEARAGHSGEVVQIDGDSSEMDQLEALGIAAGVTYRVARSGDPLIVSVLGTRVAVSRELATRIRIKEQGPQ